MSCFNIGEHKTITSATPKLNSRTPQHTMTNDPGKVWPQGVVHYVMDKSLSEFGAHVLYLILVTRVYMFALSITHLECIYCNKANITTAIKRT